MDWSFGDWPWERSSHGSEVIVEQLEYSTGYFSSRPAQTASGRPEETPTARSQLLERDDELCKNARTKLRDYEENIK